MTDGEPEPFRMSTGPTEPTDADGDRAEPEATDDTAAQDAGSDPDVVVGGVESIDDLIDEATRTAADQAERQASGEAAEDRSADVWGDGGTDGDVDAVWAAAQDSSSGQEVWGAPDADGDVWSDDGLQWSPASDAASTGRPEDPAQRPTGRPAAAEGMDDGETADDEPGTFTFAVDDDDEVDTDSSHGGGTGDARPPEEPEPFRFEAGPATNAPAQVPDHVADADAEEPEAFTFGVDEDTAQDDDRTDRRDVEEWTVPSADAADGDEEPADDVWTSDVTTETRQDDGTEAPLAESATPRDEAGWRDLDAEQEPDWSVPDLPLRRRDDAEEEPGAFTAHVEDTDDDAPWSSGTVEEEQPAGHDPVAADLPADVVTAEVHDALGDLLGNGDDDHDEHHAAGGGGAPITAPVPAQDSTPVPTQDTTPVPADDDADLDHFDELADLDLDQFDDLEATADEPPAEPADEARADEDTGEEAADDDTLDAPTAARQVMEPGSVTFSSGGRKRRGLFG